MPKSSLDRENGEGAAKARASLVDGRLPFKPINAASATTRPSSAPSKQRNPLKPQTRPAISKDKQPMQQQSLFSTLRTVKPTTSASSDTKKDSTTKPTKKLLDPHSMLQRSRSAHSKCDKVVKDWLNKPTPKKNSEKPQYDRHIPNHNSMASLNYHFAKATAETSQYLEHGAQTYREHIAEVVGISANKRILDFGTEPPEKRATALSSNNSAKNAGANVAPPRRILTAPEKTLDAPYMTDDFYLNLLDWSNRNVVAIALDKSIYLWNADYGTVKTLAYESDEAITGVKWETNGQFLAVGTGSGDTQIWDVEANTKLRSMRGHQGRVGVLSWNKYMVSSGARDGSIWHHDVRAAQHKVSELDGHEDEVCGLEWRPDGMMLASGGNDNIVHLWDARSTKPKYTKTNHSGAVKAIAWCPWDTNLVATGGGREDTHIHFWNSSHGGKVKSVHTGSQVTSLLWSKHHREIVSTHGFPKNQLTVWGYPALNRIVDIPGHESRILHSAISPDGQVVATAAADENLKFWRIFEHDGKQIINNKDRANVLMRRSNSLR
ncbi:WD40-repeat-containing domain protein [Fennellomyces sp. T-0311]|nr:WD40-repeat-containing domain protein [Fennellomyces sp. T-0311]